jgi:hypothetical protein
MGSNEIIQPRPAAEGKVEKTPPDLEVSKEKVAGEDWTVVASREPYGRAHYTAQPGERVLARGVTVDAGSGSLEVSGLDFTVNAAPGSHIKVRTEDGRRANVNASPGSDIDARGPISIFADGGHIKASEGVTVFPGGGNTLVDLGAGASVYGSKGAHIRAGSGAFVDKAQGGVIYAEKGASLQKIGYDVTVHAPTGIDMTLSDPNTNWLTVPAGAVHMTSAHPEHNVLAAAGSTVTATDRHEVVAREGSLVTAEIGSTVIAAPGATVRAKYGSTVLAFPGAIVERQPGAKVIEADASQYAGPQFDDRIAPESFDDPGKGIFYEWRHGDNAPAGTRGEATFGTVHAKNGSHVEARPTYAPPGREPKVIAEPGAFVVAHDRARVEALPDSRVIAKAYSSVLARNGALVRAESDAKVEEEPGAIVSYEDGSVKRLMKSVGFGFLTPESGSERERRLALEERRRNRHIVIGTPIM